MVRIPEHPLGLRVLEGAGKFDPAARGFGVVREEPRPVVLSGQGHAQTLAGQLDGAHAHQTVRGQAAQVPDLPAWEYGFIPVLHPNPVPKVPAVHHLHAHPVGVNRHELGDFSLGVGDDLAESIAPQGQVSLKHLAPLKGVLEPVGLAGKEAVEPVIGHPILASVFALAVHHHRKRRHGLRQDAHTGIYRCEPQRPVRRDAHA